MINKIKEIYFSHKWRISWSEFFVFSVLLEIFIIAIFSISLFVFFDIKSLEQLTTSGLTKYLIILFYIIQLFPYSLLLIKRSHDIWYRWIFFVVCYILLFLFELFRIFSGLENGIFDYFVKFFYLLNIWNLIFLTFKSWNKFENDYGEAIESKKSSKTEKIIILLILFLSIIIFIYQIYSDINNF